MLEEYGSARGSDGRSKEENEDVKSQQRDEQQ